MVLKRSEIVAPELPQEEVEVPPLGGSVIVRGMDMPQLLGFMSKQREACIPKPGESEEQANQRGGVETVSLALALTVHAEDGPLFTEPQWRAFGAQHMPEAIKLFGVAMRLSGQDAAAERKNS